jgi:hypothetical protein
VMHVDLVFEWDFSVPWGSSACCGTGLLQHDSFSRLRRISTANPNRILSLAYTALVALSTAWPH